MHNNVFSCIESIVFTDATEEIPYPNQYTAFWIPQILIIWNYIFQSPKIIIGELM